MAASATTSPPRSTSARRASSSAPHARRRGAVSERAMVARFIRREAWRMVDLFSFSPQRRALVTGGASGLGLGAARRLLDIGATVAIADLPAALERMPAAEKGRFLAIGMD